MSDGPSKFIAVVAVHFPLPKFPDDNSTEDAWMASWLSYLAPFSDKVLNEAAHEILRTRSPKKDGRWFPAPSEVIEVCERIKRAHQLAGNVPLLSHGRKDQSEWAGWRVELANDLVKSVPPEAKKQSWIGSLWHFARKFGRLPKGPEVAAVEQEAKQFEAALAACEAGEAGDQSRALLQLGRALKARREVMAKGEYPVGTGKVVAAQFGKEPPK